MKVDEIEIVFAPAAFKHGICREQIEQAIANMIYDETIESEPNKTLFIGFDHNGEAIEVIVNVFADKIVAFHAMKCRKVYIDRIRSVK
jgi:hypothetical protein